MSQAGLIDGLQFARAALERRGSLSIESLPRLAQMQGSTEGLEYRLRGGIASNGKACLWISVQGNVGLVCQRCLGSLSFPLDVEAELQLAEDPREIAQAQDDIDRVLALAAMDVAQLVEDEVILALPMVPRHEACLAAGAAPETRASPFDALAALRRGDNRS
jgi:uncharacterized protein